MQRSWYSTRKQGATSNLLHPIRFRKPNSTSAPDTGNAVMDDLTGFCPITIYFRFIMTTLQYVCAIVSKNCIGIGPDSAISVRLCPLCHGGFSERLLKWAFWDELDASNLKCCPMFMITVLWPLHELLLYIMSLQTNILALLSIKTNISNFYILKFCPLWI